MRKRIWLVLALALTLSVLGIASRVRGAGDVIPPQVIDTAQASVEGAITASTVPAPGVTGQSATTLKGSFSWINDSTVLFKPADKLTRDTEYAFSVSSDAKSKAGSALRDKYSLK